MRPQQPTKRQKAAKKRGETVHALRRSFEEAIQFGTQTRGRVVKHELGHLIPLYFLSDSVDRFRIVTVRPKPDDYDGCTVYFERKSYTRAQLKAKLVMLVGGRAAEELFLVSIGHSYDARQWKLLANKIVQTSQAWNNRPSGQRTNRHLAQKRKEYIDEAMEKAKQLIEDNRALFSRLSYALFKEEWLGRKDIKKLTKRDQAFEAAAEQDDISEYADSSVSGAEFEYPLVMGGRVK